MIRHLILILFLVLTVHTTAQNYNNNAFTTGEELTYRIYYSSAIIDATAGEAVLKVEDWTGYKTPEKDTVFHIIATGESKGLFNFFYKVRDKYESYIDKKTLLPYVFVRNTHEGDYRRYDYVTFGHDKLMAKTSRKTLSIPDRTYDLISAIYFMRTLDISDFNADSMYIINFYLDDSIYHSAVKYLDRDTLNFAGSKVPVLKIAPMMATGEVFAEKYPMYLWVTDDRNHIPVKGTSKIIVGSINIELTGYKNLKNPFINSNHK